MMNGASPLRNKRDTGEAGWEIEAPPHGDRQLKPSGESHRPLPNRRQWLYGLFSPEIREPLR